MTEQERRTAEFLTLYANVDFYAQTEIAILILIITMKHWFRELLVGWFPRKKSPQQTPLE